MIPSESVIEEDWNLSTPLPRLQLWMKQIQRGYHRGGVSFNSSFTVVRGGVGGCETRLHVMKDGEILLMEGATDCESATSQRVFVGEVSGR